MKKKTDDKLIARYVAGECSEPEEQTVRIWLSENPEERITIERLRKKWASYF
jgi:uncharacterized protein YggL (DUF469 family)